MVDSKFIDEALVDPEKDGRISAIGLVHMVGQQRQEVYTVKIGATSNHDGAGLEKLLKGKAETHAQDMDTVQSFALLFFYGGKNTEQGVQLFKVLPQINPETAGLSTEAPTAEGRMQQKMRWDDALQMQVYRRQQTMDDHSVRMLEQQDKMLQRSQTMLEKVMNDNMEGFTIIKELLNERAMGQHNHAMEQAKFHRETGREWIPKFAVDHRVIAALRLAKTGLGRARLNVCRPHGGRLETRVANATDPG